jgi:hypothetical protein
LSRNLARPLRRGAVLITLAALVVPLSSSSAGPAPGASRSLAHVSQVVADRYYARHPDQVPAELSKRQRALRVISRIANPRPTTTRARAPEGVVRFNRDGFGLPQNEESVAACRSNPDVVLGGTNDYRGLLDPTGAFTGWHLSTDGGRSVRNEGRLPAVDVRGLQRPSGGDPVQSIGAGCSLYAASLNYDPDDPFGQSNGIGVYRTSVDTLATCPGGGHAASCWPNRRAVATSRPGHFLDKEWMTVGTSGSTGQVVWATFTDFTIDDTAPLGFTKAEIFAVRCSADLARCTQPILISGADKDTQFSDVTVGPDGRTYVSWTEIQGELEQTEQTFIHKLRVAPAGTTNFGPTRIVAVERNAIPFGGSLHANGLRIATIPKNAVALVNGRPRVYIVWDACAVRVADTICENASIRLRYSDDLGATWTPSSTVSTAGENYFPTIDAHGGRLAVAYFTSRYDPVFHNRQDIELAYLDAGGGVIRRERLTPFSNESEADPLFNDGRFIGDYIEVALAGGRTYVHFNANYVSRPLVSQGLPVPQQDNFLVRRG